MKELLNAAICLNTVPLTIASNNMDTDKVLDGGDIRQSRNHTNCYKVNEYVGDSCSNAVYEVAQVADTGAIRHYKGVDMMYLLK